jgi:hypothetical protein
MAMGLMRVWIIASGNTILAKLVIVGELGIFFFYYCKQTVLLRRYPFYTNSNDIVMLLTCTI